MSDLPHRPLLTPAARRLWRDGETLQLGRTPGRAVVLAGLDPAARSVLPLLDGSRDRAAVVAAAGAQGCRPERTVELVALLQRSGLVVDAATAPAVSRQEHDRLAPELASLALCGGAARLDRRRRSCVLVLGAGRVGAVLAALLDAAGVGAVEVVDDGATRAVDVAVGGLDARDVGAPRGSSASARLRSAGRRTAAPDLVVLAPAAGTPLDELAAALPPGAAHLVAEVRDTVGVVGPLVLPGWTACLHCLDHARTDRDPGWPSLAAQLSTAVRATAACDGVLAAAVAAQAALQALAVVEGDRPATAGGTLELALPDWRWRRRSWRPHPACGCVPADTNAD